MNSTPLGLSIKMAGENPVALEAQGIDVFLVRAIAVVLGSAFMAVGGAYLTLSAFDAFYFGMINGRGWIAIALVILHLGDPTCSFRRITFCRIGRISGKSSTIGWSLYPLSVFLMLPFC